MARTKRRTNNNAEIPPQKRGAKTRKRNAKVMRDAFRRGRRQGWRDVLVAYLANDGESFQDWLYTLTGHNE
jgi:hypothetical protein